MKGCGSFLSGERVASPWSCQPRARASDREVRAAGFQHLAVRRAPLQHLAIVRPPCPAQQRAKVGGSSSCSAARRYPRRRCCSWVSCAAPEARGEVSHGLPAGWGTVMEVMGIPIQSCASSPPGHGGAAVTVHRPPQTHYVVSIPGTNLVLSTLILGTRIPFSTSNLRIIPEVLIYDTREIRVLWVLKRFFFCWHQSIAIPGNRCWHQFS